MISQHNHCDDQKYNNQSNETVTTNFPFCLLTSMHNDFLLQTGRSVLTAGCLPRFLPRLSMHAVKLP